VSSFCVRQMTQSLMSQPWHNNQHHHQMSKASPWWRNLQVRYWLGRFPTIKSVMGRWLSYRKPNSKRVRLYARPKFPEFDRGSVSRISIFILYRKRLLRLDQANLQQNYSLFPNTPAAALLLRAGKWDIGNTFSKKKGIELANFRSCQFDEIEKNRFDTNQ
jgi:hypothetical protein